MALKGSRQYDTSAGAIAIRTLASLNSQCQVKRGCVAVAPTYPVDTMPVTMMACVGTLATRYATITLHTTPETLHGMNRIRAPTGPTCWMS